MDGWLDGWMNYQTVKRSFLPQSTRDISRPLSPVDINNDSDLQILSVSGTPTDIREYHSNRK